MPKPKKHVLVCVQGRPAGHPRGSCQEKGCAQTWQAFSDEFTARNLWSPVSALREAWVRNFTVDA